MEKATSMLGLVILVVSILPSAYRYLKLDRIPTRVDMILMFTVTILFIVEKAVSVFSH